MAKDNDQFAREKTLAREYEKKMEVRTQAIKKKILRELSVYQISPYEMKDFSALFSRRFSQGFTDGKYEKPSQFFTKEMPWIFDLIIYDRFRDAFLHAVDHVRDYPYSVGWDKRSFRSSNYLNYTARIAGIVSHFQNAHSLDADIRDALTGNLPEDARCYLKTRNTNTAGFVPEVLAYELDKGDPRLEEIVTEIVNGDSEFSTVSQELIQGIVLSRNPRMHQLLCRLLLAARLQEGLRQSICEAADCGSKEAFQAVLDTILEHDLIRYSSVKRAVGTWVGVISYETRDLDRISTKSVELICKCLQNPAFREECLASEDAMAIHIALWSDAFEEAEKGYRTLDRIIDEGTHHQVLTAGYFVSNLESPLLRHVAARDVLKSRRERYDILAAYLPSFVPFPNYTANTLANGGEDPVWKHYFETSEQATEMCDWLMEVHGSMKQKEMVFDPCIFPWYRACVKKSDLVEKAMVIAAMVKDQARIEKLCPHLADCDAFGRNIYFNMLTRGKKTPVIRRTIIDALEDKSTDTRRAAYMAVKVMTLTAEEYRRVEDMLRLRYDDLRRNAMELLMKQSDADLTATICRLLASAKAPMRMAGLDMVTQLQKSENRGDVANACMEAVQAIAKPTGQEKTLIDALMPKRAKVEEPRFTEADRYDPVVEIDDYAMECIRTFMEIFPQSKLEKQIIEGKPVRHNGIKLPVLPCATAKKAQQNLRSLSDFVTSHEKETYEGRFEEKEIPIGSHIHNFHIYLEEDRWTVPRMDLWEQWRDVNHITINDLFGMLVACCGQDIRGTYLIRCGKYIDDLYGPGFENHVDIRYEEHVQRIVHSLIYNTIPQDQAQNLAMAIGIWIARCLPDDMVLGTKCDDPAQMREDVQRGFSQFDSEHFVNAMIRDRIMATGGHFIAHPQIESILDHMSSKYGPRMKQRIPVLMNVYVRSFLATHNYFESFGVQANIRQIHTMDRLFQSSAILQQYRTRPGADIYLYACHCGLINERTLHCHLMDPEMIKDALELVTAVCAIYPAEGDVVSAKTFTDYSIRRICDNFLGKDTPLSEDQLALVALCRKTADALLPIVLDTELNRGDTPTKYSACVTGIHVLSGGETFVKILLALGKDALDRSAYYCWGSNNSKRGNLSYLLSRCTPGPEDDAGKLKSQLAGTDITEKRLVEAALYSPAWIDIIGEFLGLPGFKSACYYFMAHMNEQFDDQKKAIIARFTPLTEDELNMGAFDVNWFRSAFDQLGEKKFNLIYDAAKYISDGSKHTRARKYADAALGRLNVGDTETAIRDKRNKDFLMAYAIIPLEREDDLIRRYLYLQQFLKESRQFGSQRSASEKRAVEAALRNLSTNAGFSDSMRLTLRMETKLVEDNRDLFEDRQIGDWIFRLEIDEQGSASILCTKDGKALKSVPAKAKKDPHVVRLQDMKKLLTDQYRRTRRMFEEAMEDCAEFTLDEMRQLSKNRVVAPSVSKLVFKSGDFLGFFDGTILKDLDGTVLVTDAQAVLQIAHPVHLYASGRWSAFQKHLYDRKLVQPFRQVFRELYVKTADELGTIYSLRYAGNQLQPQKAAACLKQRRWVADIEAGLQKVYYRENIVATIYALADWFTPADIEAPTLEYVAFYHRRTGEPLKIDEIPDVIFSEVMRDVDLAVSVAHVGGVDPENSHSTVEMRAAILEFTLPLLRLDNVRIEGSHAFIDGKLAKYSVHLGSGTVHQIGGAMLNVLPVHSQHRGRIFLPFVDDDPKTAEIISKVILFSEDRKLKDPTILSQIKP